jgi:hypothetical protein
MQQEEIEKLKFRRQYILAPHEINPPFLFQKRTIGNTHYLYTHVDLTVTDYSFDGIRLVLLGDIFDYDIIQKTNLDILKDIVNKDINLLLKKLSAYTGCYVLLYIQNNKIFLSHDVTATKKIYHCLNKSGIWCTSQPTLLARTLCLERSKNESKIRYYNSVEFERLYNAGIGDTTYYDEIAQILPNHYLDLSQNRSIRYWPFESHSSQMNMQETANFCAKVIKGYVESIALRYKVMLPVTAGKDSRTLLAATRNIREDVFYYINKHNDFKDNHKDIKIPSRLFKKLGLDYHIIDPYIPVDKDFEKVYFENNEFASKQHLPFIYNYYKNFSDRVNLPGNIATGAIWYYPIFRKKMDKVMLAKINGVQKYPHALSTYNEWIRKSQVICKDYDFNLWFLFYWEERLGNWGTQYQMDKDIAQMDINPFNSRLLVENILSVHPKSKLETADYPFTKEIIKNLWPEVLGEPINPNLRNTILSLFNHLGLLHFVFKLKYR